MRQSERERLEALEELNEDNEKLPLEKNDNFAIWIAGMLTVGLPILGLLTIIFIVVLLLC